MFLRLDEKLFPKDSAFDRKRKMALVMICIFGVILLVSGVAFLVVEISR